VFKVLSKTEGEVKTEAVVCIEKVCWSWIMHALLLLLLLLLMPPQSDRPSGGNKLAGQMIL
jgi:hypothetical protein